MGETFGQYTAHPIACKWRMLPADELSALSESITREGQAIPCVVWRGWLVDGRNRWRACELAGVEPRVEHREFADDAECGRWIIAVNKDRRHDSPSQLAMIASDPDVMACYRAEAKERQREAGGDRKSEAVRSVRANLPEPIAPLRGRETPAELAVLASDPDIAALYSAGGPAVPARAALVDEYEEEHSRLRHMKAFGDEEASERAAQTVRHRHGLPEGYSFYGEGDEEASPAPAVAPESTRARAKAAEAFGVSPRLVQSASTVRERGAPELVAAVERGEVKVSAAEQITKLPAAEQVEVVAAGPAAVKEVAAEIRKTPANFTSLSDLWFTPSAVVEAARELLGGFDLDPASCAEANENVKAATYFTQADNGLAQAWHGRVWCNPPYGRDTDHVSNQAKWTAYMADQYDEGNFEAGCLLVTFVPDRAWFERMWNYPMCAFRDRLKFRVPGGNVPDSPTSANVVVYFGKDVERFARIFSRFGRVLVPRGAVTEIVNVAA